MNELNKGVCITSPATPGLLISQNWLTGSVSVYLAELHNGSKDWELTFLFRAFGLSEELSTEVGFVFSNNGFKSQDLRFRMKKKIYGLFDNVSWFQILSWNSYHTFDIQMT